MHHENVRVSDCISLLSVNTNKFKTAALRISVSLPLSKRDFILSRLLCGMISRGTKSYPSLELINKRLDSLYASCVSVNSTILENLIILNVSADILDRRFVPDSTDVLTEVLNVISEMIFEPSFVSEGFPCDKLEHEKNLLRDSYLAKINDPRTYASQRAEELRRKGDLCFPTLEYVINETQSVSMEELVDYYRSVLSFAPWRVIYVGSESASEISQKLQNSLGRLGGDKTAVFEQFTGSDISTKAVEEEMPINQSRLSLGFRTKENIDERTCNALCVMNAIFGGTPSSKLFLNVRERLGLCYSCGSSFSSPTQYLKVSAGISACNREITEREILSQLNEIQKGNVSDAELLAARKYIEFTFDQTYDSPFSIVSFYSSKEHLGTFQSPEERKKALLDVSLEDIVRAANSLELDTRYFLGGTLTADGGAEE